jgi:hypothetical protein
VYLRLRKDGSPIFPQDYSPSVSGEEARLVFAPENLRPGEYEIYIKNPGGLDTFLGTFRIAASRLIFDLNVSLAYAPLIPLYGELNEFFDSSFFPLGVLARISFIPVKRDWGSLGLELAPFWAHLSMSGDEYDAAAWYGGVQINLLFQRWLSNQIMAFNFRAGAGLAALNDLHFEYSGGKSESQRTLMPSAGLGLSFMWFVNKPLFLEFGLEYMHFFSVDNPSPGYARPWLSLGRQW